MKRILQITAITALVLVAALGATSSAKAVSPSMTIGSNAYVSPTVTTNASIGIYDTCNFPTSFWADSSYTRWYYGPVCSLDFYGNAWNYRTWHLYNRAGGYLNSYDCKSAWGVPETCNWRYR